MSRLKPLPPLAISDLQPTFYDVQSVSTIEMNAKFYAYLQNLVDDYNAFVTEINANIRAFECGTDKNICKFKKCVMDMMTNYIETVDTKIKLQNVEIQNAIDYMKTNLTETVNELFASALENGEIIATISENYNANNEELTLYIEGQGGN